MARRNPIQTYLVPAVCALALVGAYFLGGLGTKTVPGTDAFHERVREAVLAVPIKIGDWIGRDVPPEPSATEILMPVVIMQRQYHNQQTGDSISLLVVYCDDARSLYGHFPPICYPNARGWSPVSQNNESVRILGQDHAAINYAFDRVVNGVDRDLSVLNFMVSPSERRPVLQDMETLTRSEPSRFTPGLGAGQVQILGLDTLDSESREESKRTFLDALEPVIKVVAEGA